MIATATTEAVLTHHLSALGAGDVAGIMSDYAPDAVVYSPDGVLRDGPAIAALFENMLQSVPPEFLQNFRITHQVVDGDLAFIVWQSLPFVPLGTDTFIVRAGKIVQQTFAAFSPGA